MEVDVQWAEKEGLETLLEDWGCGQNIEGKGAWR